MSTDSLTAHFRAMARNNAWSNARLLDACRRLSDEDLAAPRTSFFPSLRATLNHNYIVDCYYLDDLEGRGRVPLDDEIPYPKAADLAPAQAAMDRRLVAFCDALAGPDLDRLVSIDRGDGKDHRDPVAAILSHLFQHQIHHRGQAHAMLAGTQVPPPQLDEFFLEMDFSVRDADRARLGLSPPA